MEFVALFTVILFIVAIAKIMRSYEMVEDLKPKGEDLIPESESKTNALMLFGFMVVFLFMVGWQIYSWGDLLLPVSASEHGVETDKLMNISWSLIFFVFIITQIALFTFCMKYYYKKGQKGHWFPHNNRLEMAWTVVPGVVLIGLVLYGLNVWNSIMRSDELPDMMVELYAEQFQWTARYPGPDGILGDASFSVLSGTNGLGILSGAAIEESIDLYQGLSRKFDKVNSAAALKLKDKDADKYEYLKYISAQRAEELGIGSDEMYVSGFEADTVYLNYLVANGWNRESKLDEVTSKLSASQANLRRLAKLKEQNAATPFDKGNDDVLLKNEFVIPKGKKIKFQFRAKDVIHSAYMPHFRTQMNCVPGMETFFTMTPTITTDEMKEITGDEDFEYYLLCNKICGASHYNMKMVIKVVEPEAYEKWAKENNILN